MSNIKLSDHSGSQSSVSSLAGLGITKRLKRRDSFQIGIPQNTLLKRQNLRKLDSESSSFKTDSDMCEMQKGDLDLSALELTSNDINALESEMNDSI